MRQIMAGGYLSREYAMSLQAYGEPLHLPECDGWVLTREVGHENQSDAMGMYPRFCCQRWPQLGASLAVHEMSSPRLLSLALVTDPFAAVSESQLQAWFPDRCFAFKRHFVADLTQASERFVDAHHRYYVRWAARRMTVEACSNPCEFLDDWERLYDTLSEKHGLIGMKRFSRAAFAAQLQTPGIVAFRASAAGETIGGQLWYVQGRVAYSHLTAVSDAGYRLRASYALYGFALEYFRGQVDWLDWGAGAGLTASEDDSLAQFKRGWSNDSRTAYFCGRVFDREGYDQLVATRNVAATSYFPAYRAGEFA